MTRITLRDLRVGQVFETGSTVIERAAIMAFAAAYDPQPMHLDDAAAEASLFGQLIASGWHVAALTMRLMVEARPFGATPLIGAEVERLRFRRPVPPGTRLRCRATIEALEELFAPGHGLRQAQGGDPGRRFGRGPHGAGLETDASGGRRPATP